MFVDVVLVARTGLQGSTGPSVQSWPCRQLGALALQ